MNLSTVPNTSGTAMEGYLLKKKRKKMQGMGRRYFRLSSAGALSYSYNPNSPTRDSLSVPLAFISASRKARTLHIDGGNTVYHCKALTLEDFDRWAAALRRFINGAQEEAAAHSTTVEEFEGGGFAGGNASGSAANSPDPQSPAFGSSVGQEELQKVLDTVAKMKQPIQDLELVAAEFRSSESQIHLTVPSPPPGPSTSPSNSNGNGGASKFRGFLGKRSNSTSQPRDTPPPFVARAGGRSPSFSSGSSASTAPVLPPIAGLGSVVAEPQALPQGSGATLSPPSPQAPFYDARSSISQPPSNDLLLRQLQNAIATLKAQHEELTTAVSTLSRPSNPSSHPYESFDRSMSPSPFAAYSRTHSSSSGLGFHGAHTRNAPSRASSSRASFSSFFSAHEGGDENWQDVAAVPGEFILEEEENGRSGRESSPEEYGDAYDSSPRLGESDRRTSGGSTTTEEEEESEGEDTDDGEATDEEYREGEEDDRATISGRSSPSPPTSPAAAATAGVGNALLLQKSVQRRTLLPSPVAGDEFSMLGMLRKNVGKDLSTIALPVSMNEPMSALERIAEELEYSELLDAAAKATDSTERLTLVATFAISATSGNKYRGSRKPFNPLLGETYECVRPDKGFQFISEKVSHQPPVFAFHGEAPQAGWKISGFVQPSQKFWGRSLEVFVQGDYEITFSDTGEVYSVRKPSSFVRNLVAGTKYLEVVGDLVVSTSSSSAQATISFIEGSAWGGVSTRNKITGKILDARGNLAVELVGRWDDSVDKKEGKNQFSRLWQMGESPPNPERYYGFSLFATQLNEITPIEDGFLAPTDSRLRPDQLAFEHGDVDKAEALKAQVEEKQRQKRREGKEPKPRWFSEEGGEGKWKYMGDYFDVREKHAFSDPDIFV